MLKKYCKIRHLLLKCKIENILEGPAYELFSLNIFK